MYTNQISIASLQCKYQTALYLLHAVIAPAGISPRGEIPRRHPSNSRAY